MARRCPLCGGPTHDDPMLCPAYFAEGGESDGAPIGFSMDPYAALDPQNQIAMQQLAAQHNQTEIMNRLLALTAEQNRKIEALQAEVVRVRTIGPGRAAPKQLAAPKFCQFCGGPLRTCTPHCRVTGERNEA